jgi:hypothetical protein
MALETFDLNMKIRPDFVWCSLLNPYPGTDIFQYSVENNHLEDNYDLGKIGHSYFVDTPIKMQNKDEISNLQKILFLGVYLRLPRELVKYLIKLPLTKLYKLIFGAGLYRGIKKVNNSSLFSSWKLALSHLSRYNFFDSVFSVHGS